MKIKVKRRINAPSEVLWKYLGDYSNIYKFNPLIKDSHFNEGTTACEIGSTRQCNMKTGDYLKERITDWKEGSHYTVEIYDTSMPVKKADATLGLNQIDDETTETYMEMEIIPKYAILKPMMYLMFKYYAAPGILKGLEKLYRTESQLKIANA